MCSSRYFLSLEKTHLIKILSRFNTSSCICRERAYRFIQFNTLKNYDKYDENYEASNNTYSHSYFKLFESAIM